ncbi:MAG TPA: hypothetical protein VJX23_06845 [Candidatus Binataceae bacterium]|nr:hypothetical protein [Candidatus Binataceae bacterium]
MSESDDSRRRDRNRFRQTIVIRRDDHIGDPIGIAWLASPETAGDAIVERLRDYLGRRVRIAKAEISRDKIEVEIESRGWHEEATRLAAAARDLQEKGAKRNALSMYREALQLDSLNADAMAGLGIILAQLENDKEALDALKHAREFGADGIEIALTMMQCAIRLGRLGAATQYAQEALRLEPRNLAARRAMKTLTAAAPASRR